jgi:hypothetical protein
LRDNAPRSRCASGSYLFTIMAAVLLLIMLPLMAAVGFMLGVVGGQWSFTSVIGGATFVLLAGLLLGGAVKLAHQWDGDQH